MIPSPPLGPYPQLALWPQVGSAPTNARIRMTIRIVPSITVAFVGLFRRAAVIITRLDRVIRHSSPNLYKHQRRIRFVVP